MKMLFKGAEAELMLTEEEKGNIIKRRIIKGYRIPEIDNSIRKLRTRAEARLMAEARSAGILVPQILEIKDFEIEMEFVDGKKAKEILNDCDPEIMRIICEKMGEYAAKLHSFDIIHGDLTTSNFILKGNELYLIDFGLGFHSKRIEDKAVDLHLLYQALKSTHFTILKDAWELILNAYAANYGDANNIIDKLKEINERGRYK